MQLRQPTPLGRARPHLATLVSRCTGNLMTSHSSYSAYTNTLIQRFFLIAFQAVVTVPYLCVLPRPQRSSSTAQKLITSVASHSKVNRWLSINLSRLTLARPTLEPLHRLQEPLRLLRQPLHAPQTRCPRAVPTPVVVVDADARTSVVLAAAIATEHGTEGALAIHGRHLRVGDSHV